MVVVRGGGGGDASASPMRAGTWQRPLRARALPLAHPSLRLRPLPPLSPSPYAPAQVDRLYDWHSVPNSPIMDSMARQPEYVRKEFDDRLNQASG